MSETLRHRMIMTDLELCADDIEKLIEADPGMAPLHHEALSEAYGHIHVALLCLAELPEKE